MIFILKQKNKLLLKFNISYEKLEIVEVFSTHLPVGMSFESSSILKWIKNRIIPYNREFRKEILESLNINPNDLNQIILVSKCLSLNDDYWIVEENFNGTFEQFNLYENKFNIEHALIAFTGKGHVSCKGALPELTTQGTLKKAWINTPDGIYLYKGSTSGFVNSGNEVYSEYYAYQIGKQMGIDLIAYDLNKWQNEVVSTSACFCTLDKSFIPMAAFLNEISYIEDINNFFKKLGNKEYDKFCSMMIFDALIYNTDRHTNNFGVYKDNNTNKILGLASLFDHGCSLFEKAYGKEISNIDNLNQYRKKLQPAIGNSFIENIKQYLGPTQIEQLQKLKTYKIKKHPLYNIDNHRLNLLNQFLEIRIEEILTKKEELILEDEVKEKEFLELTHTEQQFVLESLKLDTPNMSISLTEYAKLFTYIPYYCNQKLQHIEIIQKC